jgi:ribosomal protein S13
MDWVIAIALGVGFILPYAIIKAFELQQRKRNKQWSDDEAEVVDNWKFPSNFY